GTLLLVSASASAAPGPKKDEVPAYWATHVGDKWVYEEKAGDITREETQVVTRVEQKGSTVIVSIGREVKRTVVPAGRIAGSDKGVFRQSTDKRDLDPPLCLLASPPKPGTAWENSLRLSDQTLAKSKYKVVGEEAIEVPAGKYRAIRVDHEYQ